MNQILIKVNNLKNNKFIKYIIIGMLNTLISIIINYIFLILGISIEVAYILSYIVGGINGFIWNKLWIFESNGKNIILLTKYVIVNIGLIILGTELSRKIAENIGKYYSPIIVPCVIVIIGFILNKKVVFISKRKR